MGSEIYNNAKNIFNEFEAISKLTSELDDRTLEIYEKESMSDKGHVGKRINEINEVIKYVNNKLGEY